MSNQDVIGLFALVVRTERMDRPIALVTDWAPENGRHWRHFFGIMDGLADKPSTEWGVAWATSESTRTDGSNQQFTHQALDNLMNTTFAADELRIVGELPVPGEYCFVGTTKSGGYTLEWEPFGEFEDRQRVFTTFFEKQGVELEGLPWAMGWRPDNGQVLCIRSNGDNGERAMDVFIEMIKAELDAIDDPGPDKN